MSRRPSVLVVPPLLVLLAATAGCASGRYGRRPGDGGAFIWEVKKGGQTVFLTGSVHLAKQGELGLTPSMLAALERSDAVALEADPAKMEQEKVGLMMVQQGMLPPEQDLFRLLEPADAQLLETRAAEAKLPREAVARMKPWLAAMLLAVGGLANAGYQPSDGTEQRVLAQLGEPRSKPVVELEGAEAQLRMMATIPDAIARLMLLEELRREEPVGTSIEKLADRWRAGDAEGLAKLLFEEELQSPEFKPLYQAMFVDRNHVMAGRIVELAESGKTHFVVVGAGHVVGDDGLLRLLADRGYTVRQLPKQ